ncbi:hypothetical protein ACHAXA_011458, partial [Cyclostephanos tholiformis]
HISYKPNPGNSTPGDVEFTIETAWRTDYGSEMIMLDFGDGTSASTGFFDIITSASAIGTFTDGAGESYTLHKHKTTHTYSSVTMPYTASFQNCCRISTLKNSLAGWYGVGTSVRLNTGLLSTPQVSLPAIIQMYEGAANSIDIMTFIFYSGSDIISCSYNADGTELAPLSHPLTSDGFASLPTAGGNGLKVTNDCKLEWDLTSYNSSTQYDKYAVSMVIKIAAKTFVQSLDFIVELVEGTPLTCAARTPVIFNAYPGETKQASFDIGGVGTVGTVSLVTTDLPNGATVGTNELSSSSLPAVWEYCYTVPVNAPIALSQTILQWRQGGFRCFQTVTVNVLAPSLECSDAYPSKTLLWPPNHKFEAIVIQGVTDLNGNEVAVAIVIDAIYSDEEPATAKGAGGATKVPDAYGVGTNIANLRAERSGVGNGRVYRIDFTASNGLGGTCQGNVWVGVPHAQNKLPVDDGALYPATVTTRAPTLKPTTSALRLVFCD